MSKNCLIYGGGGFIGSHLCEELISKGYNVTVFDKINFSKVNINNFKNNIKIIEGDFNNAEDLKKSLINIDIVYHLVSSTLPASSNENPVYDVETNLISTLNLLNMVISSGIEKFIFISSGGTVYGVPEIIPVPETYKGNPLCSYGLIKKTIEDYLFLYNYLHDLNYTVLRLANPFGERQNPLYAQGAIPVFLWKIINKNEIVIWGDGTVKRDYIYIKDAVKAMVSVLKGNNKHKIYNIGSGVGRSLNEILEVLEEVTGEKVNIRYENSRLFDVKENVLDIKRISSEFGWKPETDFRIGIKKTYEYIINLLEN